MRKWSVNDCVVCIESSHILEYPIHYVNWLCDLVSVHRQIQINGMLLDWNNADKCNIKTLDSNEIDSYVYVNPRERKKLKRFMSFVLGILATRNFSKDSG